MTLILRRAVALAVSLSLLPVPAGPLRAAGASGDSSAPSTPAERASLDKISVGADQIQIQLSRPAKYNTFTTARPPRVVLEILGANVNLSARVLAGQGGNLKRVRAGQFQGEPDPISRVVLDLGRLVRYTVTPQANTILVRLEAAAPAGAKQPEAAPAVPEAAKAPAPAEAKPPAPAVARPAPGVARPAPAAPAAKQPASIEAVPSASAAVPKDATKNLAKPVASQELAAMAAQSSAEAPASGGALGAKTAYPPQEAASSRRPARDILAGFPKDPVSLDLQDTEIGDVFKLLSAKADTNIIFGPDVTGTVSLHLNNVPFNEAFNVVLGLKSLMVFQVGDNTLRIVTAKQLAKERLDTVGVSRVFPIYYSDVAEIKRELDAVRTTEKRFGQTVMDTANNALIVTDTPEGLAASERLIANLDIRPRQVLIETKLVEVTLSKDLELGIQWDYLSRDTARHFGQIGQDFIGGNPTPSASPFVKPFDTTVLAVPPVGTGAGGRGTGVLLPAAQVMGALTLGRVTNNYFLSATLTAAASKGKVKVLSDPKVATVNGKPATINITNQIPYITSTVAPTGQVTQQIAFTTSGIQLTVTPLINADGRISLHVTPQVSNPTAVKTAAGVTGAVQLNVRQADTHVVVRDGETIVIGGLITDQLSDTVDKVPFLGDIPIIGWLFKRKSVSRTRVELLVFVTTKLLPD